MTFFLFSQAYGKCLLTNWNGHWLPLNKHIENRIVLFLGWMNIWLPLRNNNNTKNGGPHTNTNRHLTVFRDTFVRGIRVPTTWNICYSLKKLKFFPLCLISVCVYFSYCCYKRITVPRHNLGIIISITLSIYMVWFTWHDKAQADAHRDIKCWKVTSQCQR